MHESVQLCIHTNVVKSRQIKERKKKQKKEMETRECVASKHEKK